MAQQVKALDWRNVSLDQAERLGTGLSTSKSPGPDGQCSLDPVFIPILAPLLKEELNCLGAPPDAYTHLGTAYAAPFLSGEL